MKIKILFSIVIFIFLIKFSFAINGCCLNPNEDVCTLTDVGNCCPTENYNEKGPANYSDCINNYFVQSNSEDACLTLSGDKQDYCVLGCCCENNSFNFKIKGECLSYINAFWVNSKNCSDSVCKDNFKKSEKINKIRKEEINVNKKDTSIRNPNFEYVDCDKESSTATDYKDMDCLDHGGRVSGGFFHGGLLNWFSGKWCKGNDKVVDYKTGFLKRCCKANMESKFNWAADPLKWLTRVKDQWYCGTCSLFAITGVAEARYKITKNLPYKDIDFSEQRMLSCMPGINCTSGIYAGDVYKYISNNGFVDENCFPYNAEKRPCGDICTDWKNRSYYFSSPFNLKNSYVVVNYGSGSFSLPTIDCVKQALKKDGPLSFRFQFGKGYFNDNNVYQCSHGSRSYHAVVLVGWDDSEQAWIFKNEWGPTWNGNGYGKLKYNDCDFKITGGFLKALSDNPSAVYCNKLGYTFTINETKLGQQGICVLPNNQSVDAWDFIEGKVGKKYSLCSINGWGIKTKNDGMNGITPEYGVCIINNSEVPITDLIGLTNTTELLKSLKTEKNTSFPNNKKDTFFEIFIAIVVIVIFLWVGFKYKKKHHI